MAVNTMKNDWSTSSLLRTEVLSKTQILKWKFLLGSLNNECVGVFYSRQ